MKTITSIFLILFSISIGYSQAKKIELKTITKADVVRFKQNAAKKGIIPYNDKFVSKNNKSTTTTKVTKQEGSNLPDNIKKGTVSTSNDKNCDKATVSYNISSKKLVPIDPTMAIKLGNVYDLNLFRSGNYSTIPYQFLNEGIIYVGGKSTANRYLRKVEAGTKNTDFQIALRDVTVSAENEYLTQRMSQNFELIYGTSEKNINAKLGAGYSDKLGNEAKLNSSLDLTSETQSYTAMYKEENYSEELDMSSTLMVPTVPNENLVYVSEVVYGKLGFFEYTSAANHMNFDLQASASGNYLGASLSANLEIGALSNDTTGKIVAKLFGSTANSDIPQSKQAFIAWANQRPSTNAMVPVGFVLKFVNDNATAIFVTSGTEPIEICSPKPNANVRFDVKIQLNKVLVEEVHEAIGDWEEDLFGSQIIASVETNLRGEKFSKIPKSVTLWSKSEESAKTGGFKVGESLAINKNIEVKNLSEEEVKSLIIVMGGKMYDYEFIGGSRYYQCLNCDKPQNNPYQRSYEFDDEGIASINQLVANAAYKSVTDKPISLNYREGSSKIHAQYSILVKKY